MSLYSPKLYVPQLSLFDTSSSDCSISLAELADRQYPLVHVCLSKRMRSGWKVQWNRGKSHSILTVPAAVELAPMSVKSALFDWAMLLRKSGKKHKSEMKIQKRKLEERVYNYLRNPLAFLGRRAETDSERNRIIRNILKRNARKFRSLKPQGNYHNLDRIFHRINREYFQGQLNARLTWSSRLGGLSTHTLQQDGEGNSYNLITISQGYDFKDVPAEIVGGVVYHECLHIVIPPRIINGRRTVHGRDFKRREKEYPYYSEWVGWHRHELRKKLKILRRNRFAFRII